MMVNRTDLIHSMKLMILSTGKPLFVGQVIDCLVLPFAPSELKTVPVTVSVDEVNKSLVSKLIK